MRVSAALAEAVKEMDKVSKMEIGSLDDDVDVGRSTSQGQIGHQHCELSGAVICS